MRADAEATGKVPARPFPPRHVYGPVPSRRLGASLGVDVVPFKVCTYDCIYCQLGPTRTLTTRRRRFYPVAEVLVEVADRLSRGPRPDVITLAGSGEPTLYRDLGELIDGIRRITDIPVALLTNGALFHRADVRAEAARAAIVLPSLDAGDEATFRAIDRPARSLTLEKVVTGLAAFRELFRGEIWLEVMVVAGANDSPGQVAAIARLARRIGADRVQLNTPVRPAFDERAVPVSAARLTGLCQHFSPPAEAVADWRSPEPLPQPGESAHTEGVLALLRRRPCTLADLSDGLHLLPNELVKLLTSLARQGAVHQVATGGRIFWRAVPEAAEPALEAG